MNAITTQITDCRDSILPTITIGAIQSSREGEIILVYLNEGETDSSVLRYDRLSWRDRTIVRTLVQDPLKVLKRRRTRGNAAHRHYTRETY